MSNCFVARSLLAAKWHKRCPQMLRSLDCSHTVCTQGFPARRCLRSTAFNFRPTVLRRQPCCPRPRPCLTTCSAWRCRWCTGSIATASAQRSSSKSSADGCWRIESLKSRKATRWRRPSARRCTRRAASSTRCSCYRNRSAWRSLSCWTQRPLRPSFSTTSTLAPRQRFSWPQGPPRVRAFQATVVHFLGPLGPRRWR